MLPNMCLLSLILQTLGRMKIMHMGQDFRPNRLVKRIFLLIMGLEMDRVGSFNHIRPILYVRPELWAQITNDLFSANVSRPPLKNAILRPPKKIQLRYSDPDSSPEIEVAVFRHFTQSTVATSPLEWRSRVKSHNRLVRMPRRKRRRVHRRVRTRLRCAVTLTAERGPRRRRPLPVDRLARGP